MEMQTIAKNIFQKVRKERIAQPYTIGFFLEQFEKRVAFSLKFAEDLISSVVRDGYTKSEILLLSDFLELSFIIKGNSSLLEFKNELSILAIQDIKNSRDSQDIYIDLCILEAISPETELGLVLKDLSLNDKAKVQIVSHIFKEFVASKPGEVEKLLETIDLCELSFKEWTQKMTRLVMVLSFFVQIISI